MADYKVKCSLCEKMFISNEALEKHRAKDHLKVKNLEQIVEVANQSAYDYLISDGKSIPLRNKANVANSWLRTQSQSKQNLTARDAIHFGILRGICQTQAELRAAIEKYMPQYSVPQATALSETNAEQRS